MFSLYFNRNLDDRIFLLFTNIIYFIPAVRDLTGHNLERLGSTGPNHHGGAVHDITMVSHFQLAVDLRCACDEILTS